MRQTRSRGVASRKDGDELSKDRRPIYTAVNAEAAAAALDAW